MAREAKQRVIISSGVVMVLETLQSQVAMALVGGVAAELFHWYALARRPGVIAKYRLKVVYWVTTIGMILLGGLMPFLYIEGPASALLCVHLGAATPIILQKLVTAIPASTVEQGPGDTSIRDFFRW